MSLDNYTEQHKARAVEGYKNATQEQKDILDQLATKLKSLKDLIDYCKTELGE